MRKLPIKRLSERCRRNVGCGKQRNYSNGEKTIKQAKIKGEIISGKDKVFESQKKKNTSSAK
jgi:hypothetical protein